MLPFLGCLLSAHRYLNLLRLNDVFLTSGSIRNCARFRSGLRFSRNFSIKWLHLLGRQLFSNRRRGLQPPWPLTVRFKLSSLGRARTIGGGIAFKRKRRIAQKQKAEPNVWLCFIELSKTAIRLAFDYFRVTRIFSLQRL